MFFVLVNALQAMGAAVASLIVNISRQGIICIPMMFILQIFLQAEGLVWAQPVADLLSLALVTVLYLTTVHKLKKQSAATLEVTE